MKFLCNHCDNEEETKMTLTIIGALTVSYLITKALVMLDGQKF